MPFRFRKTFKLGKGLRLNLSKSGISTTIGKRGASLTVGKRGIRSNIGIPGTGLSYSSQIGSPNTERMAGSSKGGGCLSGLFNLAIIPVRMIVDLIKGLVNPQSRRSTAILLGGILATCLVCYGGSSVIGMLGDGASTVIPSPTIAVPTETLAPTIAPTETVFATNTFLPVSLADYPRIATSRFQTLQENFAELVNIHSQFAADPTLATNNDWYFHATAILDNVVVGAHELASMSNAPVEYLDFQLSIQKLATEVSVLEPNYLAAFDHQDMNAFNLATSNLTNAITYVNEAHSELQPLLATSTPLPSRTPIPTSPQIILPTSTVVFIPPPTAAQSNCHPSYPDVCIPYPPPDLDCGDIPYRNFRIVGPDVHNFDGRDNDGRGCES